MTELGITAFRELAIPLEDVRGLGIIMSKLSDDHSIVPVDDNSASGHDIASWLKKGKKTDAKDNGAGIDQSKSNPFEKEPYSKQNDGVVDAGGDIKDLVASLPRHFQRDLLSDDDSTSTGGHHFENLAAHSEREGAKIERTIYASLNPIEENVNGLKTPQRDNMPSHTEDGLDMNVPTLTQLALPPLSQIRMSQVLALPPELQEQIRLKIQGRETPENNGQPQIEYIDVDDPSPTHMAQPEDEVAIGDTSRGHIDAVPHQQYASLDQGNRRFRQPSLRRMMRLAAVKSGQETTGISLTQLEHLPLEIKLQIVNEDARSVGALSQRKPVAMKGLSSKDRLSTSIPDKEGNRKHAMKTIDKPAEWQQDDIVETDSEEESATPAAPRTTAVDTSSEGKDEPLPKGPDNIYEEDILPLKLFLNENPPVDPEAVNNVIQFLKTCLREGRLRDMVTLIRSIRNRRDDWGDLVVLEDIVQSLDEEHLQIHGTRLDVDWLIGK